VIHIHKQTKQTPWPESASELYRPSDRRLSAKLVVTSANRGSHVVSVRDPYGRILGFLDRTCCVNTLGKKKLSGLSPRANYNDRATSACRRSWCQVVSMADPYRRMLDFPDRSRYLFFHVAAQLYSRGSMDTVPDRGDPLRRPRDALYPQKLALTSSTSGDRSIGTVRSLNKATEFLVFYWGIFRFRC
jgi:hypothetical protein